MSAAAVPGANRAGMVGSAVVHLALLAGLLLVARGASAPPPLVYEVNLVAAPAPGPTPRRAAEAALPARRDEEVAPPEKPRPKPKPAEQPPKPKSDAPERPDPQLQTRSDVTPLPGETPSTGTDQLTFRQEGLRFPYPDYLKNIVTQVRKRWVNPAGKGLRLRTEVAFTIQRDGTVTDISVSRRSGNFTFDTEAIGAVERAGKDGAFGPLPDGFNGLSLPIAFAFTPEDR